MTPETSELRPVGVAFQGVMTTTLDLSTAKIWVDGENVEHVRGARARCTTEGEAAGLPLIARGGGIVNWDIELDSGNGIVFSQESNKCTWGSMSGGFVGTTQCEVSDWRVNGCCGWSGGGDFAGMQFEGTFDVLWQNSRRELVGVITGP
jgi:hypothetical protein